MTTPGHRVARMHGVGVHHPGHDLGIGVDVRGRDVLLGTDEDPELGREPSRQPFQLTLGQLLGVDSHAALAATERDTHHGALPGHPHGEGLDLVQVDVLVVPEATLGGAAHDVVMHPIAREDAHRAVVHLHREVALELPLGLPQDQAHAGIKVEQLRCAVELSLCHMPGVDGLGGLLDGHEMG